MSLLHSFETYESSGKLNIQQHTLLTLSYTFRVLIHISDWWLNRSATNIRMRSISTPLYSNCCVVFLHQCGVVWRIMTFFFLFLKISWLELLHSHTGTVVLRSIVAASRRKWNFMPMVAAFVLGLSCTFFGQLFVKRSRVGQQLGPKQQWCRLWEDVYTWYIFYVIFIFT